MTDLPPEPTASEAVDDGELVDEEIAPVDADCIVVGGGVAGLVAARELVLGGLSVILLERSAALGGKVRTHVLDGLALDAGAESFATRRGTVADLAERLGLGEDVELPEGAGAWLQVDDSTAAPLPVAGLLGIPSVPLAADVIEIVGLAGALRAQLDSLLPGVVGSKEQTLGGLVRRRMGRRVVDRLVAPVTMGVHSRHPDDLDVDAVAPGLRSGLKAEESLASAVRAMRAAAPAGSAVAGIRGGVARIVATLEAAMERFGVDVRRQATVTAADATTVTLSDGATLSAHVVVLATPDRGITESARAQPVADGEGIVLATLVVHSDALDSAPRGSGVLVASECTAVVAKAVTHATAKWSWLAEKAGEHRHVIRLSYDARRVADLDEAALRRQAVADASILLATRLSEDDVVAFARVEWEAGTKEEPREADGIVRIGETVAGTGLAAVVAHAQEEARRVVQDFDSRRREGMIEE